MFKYLQQNSKLSEDRDHALKFIVLQTMHNFLTGQGKKSANIHTYIQALYTYTSMCIHLFKYIFNEDEHAVPMPLNYLATFYTEIKKNTYQ